MKTNYTKLIGIVLFALATTAFGETKQAEKIAISGTKFTYPLIEKWISEYAKVNPDVKIVLVQKSASTIDLNVVAHQPSKEELKDNQEIVYAGRYALLPVTNSSNPLFAIARKKGFTKKEVDKLFFDVINYDDEDEPKKEKPKFASTIYARENQACASTALASYFGHSASEIRGKKVFGDDIHLLSALKKDTVGITYNNLGYLFDTTTRKLKDGIALLPLDVRKENKDLLNGNVDDVIALLEKTQIETIPVEKVGFIFSQQVASHALADFLKWVLNDGQKYNHNYGFLNLSNDVLAQQKSKLTETNLTLK